MGSLDDRIREALKDGPLSTRDLAEKLWPLHENPKTWNYSSNGGPPGWILPLGKAVKRMGLRVIFRDRKKFIGLP